MKKTKLNDCFHDYLIENTPFDGIDEYESIPSILDMHNTEIPNDLIPFEKIKQEKNHRKYVHFYMHDEGFIDVLTNTRAYVSILKTFDGVISPDPTIKVGQKKYLQQTNTYYNRAVGAYLQKQGIPVIPNIRWGDERTYEFCFLGVPKNIIVSISTHGCILSNKDKDYFRKGLAEMLKRLEPSKVIVHGYMPDSVFGDFLTNTRFHRFQSQFEKTHPKIGNENGIRL